MKIVLDHDDDDDDKHEEHADNEMIAFFSIASRDFDRDLIY